MKKYINITIKFCSFTVLCMGLMLFSKVSIAQTGDCVNAQCVGVGGTYPSGVGTGNVDDMVAGGCGGVLNPNGAPIESNSAWFYAEIASTGDLTLTLNTTADYDYVVWGPYTDLSDALTNGCGGSVQNTNGAAPEVTCDFTTAVPDIQINGVTTGEVYLIFLDNFTGDGAGFTLGVAGTASVICPNDCAATCADASGNSCSNYVTPAAMQVTSYTEIQANGGEACFNSGSIDATGGASATQCFEYTHTEPNSPGFFILSGTSIIESGDTDDTPECDQAISTIEIFDSACGAPLASGAQGTTLNNANVGTTYTICVTGTASDNANTDDGATCLFSCMAHSVTPLAPVVCDADNGAISITRN